MDFATYYKLKRLSLRYVNLIKLKTLQVGDREFTQIKSDRTFTEYCWITKPILMLYILKSHEQVKRLTYLDSDLYFFSSYNPIFSEMGTSSVLLSSHRIQSKKDRIDSEKNYGKYNAGLISIVNDRNGIGCLQWWRKKCLTKWTKNHRGGDQKYLDMWPVLFNNVSVLKNDGVNLGPWNIAQYRIKKKAGVLFVNSEKVVCYHFSKVFVYHKNDITFFLSINNFPEQSFNTIYTPYLQHLRRLLKSYNHAGLKGFNNVFEENRLPTRIIRKSQELIKILTNGINNTAKKLKCVFS